MMAAGRPVRRLERIANDATELNVIVVGLGLSRRS